jgi:hypothetical protein
MKISPSEFYEKYWQVWNGKEYRKPILHQQDKDFIDRCIEEGKTGNIVIVKGRRRDLYINLDELSKKYFKKEKL